MIPYKVIGVYRPAKWRASLVGHDLTELTARLGYAPHVDEIHGPLHLTGRNWSSILLHAEVRRRSFKTKMAESFHYDGDNTPGSKPDCLICIWASNTPTLIKWKNSSEIFQPRPYEVVVFSNMQCLHRRPDNAPRVRWIYRQRLAPREL